MPRALDILFSALGAILLAPLLIIILLVVRACLGSPVLFVQARAGREGRAFQLVKLRTMRADTDSLGRLLPDSERTPPIGRFLRRTRLDELPELVNILRGEMAFVGPRPLLPETIHALGNDGELRGSVRPGLTGWAQVNGNVLLTLQEKVALDLWYISRRSLRLDLEILLRTVGVVLFGERIRNDRLEDALESGHRRRC